MNLPDDVARCPGIHEYEECADCMRRTSPPANDVCANWMEPPACITFCCPFYIAPNDQTDQP